MTEPLMFWPLAVILIAIALAVVWFPLLRRRNDKAVDNATLNIQAYRSQLADLETEYQAGRVEQKQYQSLKTELERNMLQDFPANDGQQDTAALEKPTWPLAMVVSVLVVGLAIGLYQHLGSSRMLAAMQQQQQLAGKLRQLPPVERIAMLEQASRQSDAGAEIWFTLAREYLGVRRYADASQAYEKVLQFTGEEADVLAEYAQVLFLAAGNQMTPKIKQLTNRTLALQPENATVLGLLGIDAFENKRYTQAINYWQRILDANPGMEGTQALHVGIARAREMLASGGEVQTAEVDTPVTQTAAELTVRVELSDALAKRLEPNDVLFVFAKAVSGPPMPLAATRLRAQLPTEVVLNDSMAMMPTAKLSSVDQVQVIARISKSGTPQAQPGDFEGIFGPVAVNTQTAIKIIIDNVVE